MESPDWLDVVEILYPCWALVNTCQLIIDAVVKQLERKAIPVPAIDGATPLLGGPLQIDSLDLAVIVVQLSEATGKDPFANGFIYFRTVQELANLYDGK